MLLGLRTVTVHSAPAYWSILYVCMYVYNTMWDDSYFTKLFGSTLDALCIIQGRGGGKGGGFPKMLAWTCFWVLVSGYLFLGTLFRANIRGSLAAEEVWLQSLTTNLPSLMVECGVLWVFFFPTDALFRKPPHNVSPLSSG